MFVCERGYMNHTRTFMNPYRYMHLFRAGHAGTQSTCPLPRLSKPPPTFQNAAPLPYHQQAHCRAEAPGRIYGGHKPMPGVPQVLPEHARDSTMAKLSPPCRLPLCLDLLIKQLRLHEIRRLMQLQMNPLLHLPRMLLRPHLHVL